MSHRARLRTHSSTARAAETVTPDFCSSRLPQTATERTTSVVSLTPVADGAMYIIGAYSLQTCCLPVPAQAWVGWCSGSTAPFWLGSILSSFDSRDCLTRAACVWGLTATSLHRRDSLVALVSALFPTGDRRRFCCGTSLATADTAFASVIAVSLVSRTRSAEAPSAAMAIYPLDSSPTVSTQVADRTEID